MTWQVDIIEGYASDLAAALNQILLKQGEVRFVLPNGVNRWTIIWVERA